MQGEYKRERLFFTHPLLYEQSEGKTSSATSITVSGSLTRNNHQLPITLYDP